MCFNVFYLLCVFLHPLFVFLSLVFCIFCIHYNHVDGYSGLKGGWRRSGVRGQPMGGAVGHEDGGVYEVTTSDIGKIKNEGK